MNFSTALFLEVAFSFFWISLIAGKLPCVSSMSIRYRFAPSFGLFYRPTMTRPWACFAKSLQMVSSLVSSALSWLLDVGSIEDGMKTRMG